MKGDVRQMWICTSLKPGYSLIDDNPKPKPKPEPKPEPKKKVVKVGSKIRIKSGANQYGTTKRFMPKVYKTTYKVKEIKGNRVVFCTLDGKTVIGAVAKSACIVQ